MGKYRIKWINRQKTEEPKENSFITSQQNLNAIMNYVLFNDDKWSGFLTDVLKRTFSN